VQRVGLEPFESHLTLRQSGRQWLGYEEALKRLLDIVLATLGLVATLPVWLIIVLAIRWDSPGPAIFVQQRVGLHGRHFRFYKFRSMYADAEQRLAEVQAHIPAAGLFVNYDVNVFAKGVNPGTPPTFADASVNPSGVMNRTDSFGFSLPGRYLVICNVRGHFIDGMYAWINVVDGEDDN